MPPKKGQKYDTSRYKARKEALNLISVRDACTKYGVKMSWVYEQLHNGRIDHRRLGSRRLITALGITQLIELMAQ